MQTYYHILKAMLKNRVNFIKKLFLFLNKKVFRDKI